MSDTETPSANQNTRELLTAAAIERDPWNAVNMAVPEAPSDELLRAALEAASRCAEEAFEKLEVDDLWHFEGMDQDYYAARRREDELNQLVHLRELAAKPVTMDAIARDPWNAIVRDLPENAAPALYAAVAAVARDLLYDTATELWPPAPFRLPVTDEEWSDLGAEIKTRLRDAQQAHGEAVERHVVVEAPRLGKTFAGGVSERVSDVVDLISAALSGFFAGKPAPEAAHDMARDGQNESLVMDDDPQRENGGRKR
jgi:hypothetical protein